MVWFQFGCRCRTLFPTTATRTSFWRKDGRSSWFRHTILRMYVAGPTNSRRMLAAVPQAQEIIHLQPQLLPREQQQPLKLQQPVESKEWQSKLEPFQTQPQLPQDQYEKGTRPKPEELLSPKQEQTQSQQPDEEDFECKEDDQYGMRSLNKPKRKSTVLQCLASTSGSSIFRDMDNYFTGKFENRERTLSFQEARVLGAEKGTEMIQKSLVWKRKRKHGSSSILRTTDVKNTMAMLHREMMNFARDATPMSPVGNSLAIGSEGAKDFVCKYIVMVDELPLEVSNTVLRHAISKDAQLLGQLFNRLVDTKKADVETYESFVMGLLKCKKLDEALSVYKEMSTNSMKGSLHMYNSLLSSLCDTSKGDAEKWEMGLQIIDEIRRVNVKPNTETFNSLMYLAYQQEKGAPALCLKLFSETRCCGCKPTLGMLNYLVRSMYEKHNQSSRKRGVFTLYLHGLICELEAGNILVTGNHPDDVQFFTKAMHICLANKNVAVAKRIMNFVLENDLVRGLHVRFFNDYMRVLTLPESSESVEEVFAQYKRLVPRYYKIDGYGFESLMAFFGAADGGMKFIPELYSDVVALKLEYFDSLITKMFALMNCRLPQNGRLKLLEVAEHALAFRKERKYTDTEGALTGLLYLYCLCDVGEDKIVAWLEFCESHYGLSRSQLATSVFRACLDYEEYGGATRAMQVILQDNMRSHASRHTDVKLLGSSFMEWRLHRFRSDVMVPLDLMSPASRDSMDSTDSIDSRDSRDSVAMQRFRSQFIDTIQKCQVTM